GLHALGRYLNVTIEAGLDEVPDGFADRESLDALRAPFGADFTALNAPHLFRVRFEKCKVKFVAETVDEEVLQSALRDDWTQRGASVAQSDSHDLSRSQVLDGFGTEGDWILEKPAHEVDAGEPVAHQHHAVVDLWVAAGTAREPTMVVLIRNLDGIVQ